MSALDPVFRPVAGAPGQPPGQIASLAAPRAERVDVLSPWAQAWQRYRRNQLALLGLLILLFYIGLALGADALAPYDYHNSNFADFELDPSHAHFMGTDFIGRDVLTLMIYSTRVSLTIGVIVPLLIILIGVPIGVVAGYAGGRLDSLLMRITDIMFAFPALLFVVLMITTFGRSLWVIFMALGVSSWPLMARVVRGEMLHIKQADYLLSARAIGARPLGIISKHILPNMVGIVAVTATLSVPTAIIAEAMLTFLGLGIEHSTPTWGAMIDDARAAIFWHPLLTIFPSLAISSLTLACAFIGDGLRDALDPRLDEGK